MADDQQLSAQDIADLTQIHNLLPDSDPRKAQIRALMGSAPASQPLSSMRPQDLAAQAMQQSGISGRQQLAPVAPRVNMQEQGGVGAAMGAYANNVAANVDQSKRFYGALGQDIGGLASGVYNTAKNTLTQGGGTLEGMQQALGRQLVAPVVQSAQDPKQNLAETLGTAAGVNSPAIKQAALNQDYASILGHSALPLALAFAGGKAAKEITPEIQLTDPNAALSSALTKGANEPIPAVVAETRPALLAEAKRTGIKVGDLNSFNEVVNSLDKRLQDVYTNVKASANQAPMQPNIPGQRIATDIMQSVDQKFPYLQQARPAVRQAIENDINSRFANRDFSIDQLDAERRAINDEHTALLAKKQVTLDQAMRDPELASGALAGNAVRDVLYDEIQRRTGEDMQGLKRQQANLASLRRQVTIQKTDLPNSQANYAGQPYLESIMSSPTLHGSVKAALEPFTKRIPGTDVSPVAKSNRRIKAGMSQ